MFSMSLLGVDEDEVGEDDVVVSCTLPPCHEAKVGVDLIVGEVVEEVW
jgi:hypothetical protein